MLVLCDTTDIDQHAGLALLAHREERFVYSYPNSCERSWRRDRAEELMIVLAGTDDLPRLTQSGLGDSLKVNALDTLAPRGMKIASVGRNYKWTTVQEL